VKDLTRTVVNEKQGNSFQIVDAGPEMFAVTKDHIHPMRKGKTPAIPVFFGFAMRCVNAHPVQCPPDGHPIDGIVRLNMSENFPPPDQFRNGNQGIILFLLDKKIQQAPIQHRGIFGFSTHERNQSIESLFLIGLEPAVDTALLDVTFFAFRANVRADSCFDGF
jgi:hypothetical protein